MKIKDIFNKSNVKVFAVTDRSEENELEWPIEPCNYELLPNDENLYIVQSKQVFKNKTEDCFICIVTPERVPEFVILKKENWQICIESTFAQKHKIVPAVASECFGDYNLYYSNENPQIGIDILKDGLTKALNKHIVAEDLAYILRDEGRIVESIEAFKISENNGTSSEYIFLELSLLYKELGKTEEELRYKQIFIDNGGIE